MLSFLELTDAANLADAQKDLGISGSPSRCFSLTDGEKTLGIAALSLSVGSVQITTQLFSQDDEHKDMLVRSILNAASMLKGFTVIAPDDEVYLQFGLKKTDGAYAAKAEEIVFIGHCKR